MQTLSIKQPYATLIAYGLKPVENRAWTTEYRGRLLVHATMWSATLFDKRLPLPVFQEYNRIVDAKTGEQMKESRILAVEEDRLRLLDEAYRSEYELLKTEIAVQVKHGETLFPMQSIVGSVVLSDVTTEQPDSVWSVPSSKYYWIFENPILYDTPTVGVKGKLRLWSFDQPHNDTPRTMVAE